VLEQVCLLTDPPGLVGEDVRLGVEDIAVVGGARLWGCRQAKWGSGLASPRASRGPPVATAGPVRGPVRAALELRQASGLRLGVRHLRPQRVVLAEAPALLLEGIDLAVELVELPTQAGPLALGRGISHRGRADQPGGRRGSSAPAVGLGPTFGAPTVGCLDQRRRQQGRCDEREHTRPHRREWA